MWQGLAAADAAAAAAAVAAAALWLVVSVGVGVDAVMDLSAVRMWSSERRRAQGKGHLASARGVEVEAADGLLLLPSRCEVFPGVSPGVNPGDASAFDSICRRDSFAPRVATRLLRRQAAVSLTCYVCSHRHGFSHVQLP